MHIKWLGTASVAVIHGACRLLFDPFVPLKGSPVPVTIDHFDGYPHIFVTHGHFDHIASIPAIVRRNPKARVHCTRAPFKALLSKGVPERNLALIAPGQEIAFEDVKLRVYPGRHAVLGGLTRERLRALLKSPGRGNLPYILKEHRVCREKDETVCYHIKAGGQTLFLMGSLNLRDEPDYPAEPGLLLLPYNGWKDNLPPAVRVIERLRPKKVILTHFDVTFPPLTTPLDITPLQEAFPGLVYTVPYATDAEFS